MRTLTARAALTSGLVSIALIVGIAPDVLGHPPTNGGSTGSLSSEQVVKYKWAASGSD
jgi:hypothetical protein